MATASGDQSLRSWNDGPAVAAVRDFVARATAEGSPERLPPAEQVAVFDNDGTLWCEKPMPIELGFILQRLAAMAEQDPALRERQPWKAAYDRDYHWLGEVITRHYAVPGPGCRCWCCTTTPSASTTTWLGPSGRWRRPRPRAGRW